MNALFIVNDGKGIRKVLKQNNKGSFEYFVFKEYLYAKESEELSRAGGIKVDSQELFSEINESFREDFVSWMAKLNNNQTSEFWCQLNLAGKSALSTRVCERVFYSACLTRILEKYHEDIVVICDDTSVVRQIKQNLKNRIVHDFRSQKPLYFLLLTVLLPGKIIHRFGLVLWRKFISGPNRIQKPFHGLIVVKTVISEGSFDAEGVYRDVYFGELLDFLKDNKRNVLVVGIVLNAYKKLLNYSRQQSKPQVFAIEQLLSVLDLFACFLRAIWMFYSRVFSACSAAPFRGIHVQQIVRDSVLEELRSSQYVANLMSALVTKKIVKHCDVERFILPFENRGWERWDMQVLRGNNRKIRIIGYQHAAITQKHTEYFRSHDENMPLPDVIITMGEITARILVNMGRYSPEIVTGGCALRQKGAYALNPLRRPNPRNVLVLLSTSTDYYSRTIAVLNGIFKNLDEYSICLRVHPLIPLNESIKSQIKFPYSEEASLSHDKAIEWCDVAIYSSSTTLVFNCLQRGKPVFYIPVDDFLDADPLFEISEAKWVVRTVDDFKQAMMEIRTMEKDQWQARIFRAQEYVRRYFGPVSKSAMQVFLE